MSKGKKGLALMLLSAVLLLLAAPVPAGAAEMQYPFSVKVYVNGEEVGEIPAFDNNYENNLYVSVTGVAFVLGGTKKAFEPVIERRRITITTGTDCTVPPVDWDEEELAGTKSASAAKYALYVDGNERKYYSFILQRGDGYDAFMTPISLAMLLDTDIRVRDGRMDIRTNLPFSVTAEEMEESGYMQGVNALVIGDASTGEIYYQYDMDEVVPIASTTKLMTYLVLMDAVAAGDCSLLGNTVISERAESLSRGPDGQIPMEAGTVVPVSELLYGMLLPSSNECALALAECAAGSQEAFVERMQKKAEELGLENAVFYNSHGLPAYDDQLIPAKVQNHMTAGEMFKLVSFLMETYPEVTYVTSTKEYYLKTLGTNVRNTNAVIYNMENAVGLKTGTTNKAGACLVTCVAAEKDGETHYLVTILFGADEDFSRGIVSEISARYALAALRDREPYAGEEPQEDEGIPGDPEAVVQKLVGMLKGGYQ